MKKILSFIYPYDIIVLIYFFFALLFQFSFDLKINYSTVFDLHYEYEYFQYFILYLFVLFLFNFFKSKKIEYKLLFSNLLELIHIVILLRFFLIIYCNLKQAIPIINPYIYDKELLDFERILHLNHIPALSFRNFFKSPSSLIKSLDKIYYSWYLIKILIITFIVFYYSKKERIIFFTSYFLTWVIGGFSALAFPSLGPIYYKTSWFADVIPDISIAYTLQQQLWNHYCQVINFSESQNYIVYIYEGIAAMPSLHVAIVALYVLFFYKKSKTFFLLSLIYLFLIQMGSFVLGWHYAIDGYAGILIACIIYGAVNKVYGNQNINLPISSNDLQC